MCAAHCSWRTRMCLSCGNSGRTSYSGMIAPPGKPKIVETPSSMRDWQIALAPFKRIDVLISVERTVALYLVDPRFCGEQKTPPPTEARSHPRGTTLLGHTHACMCFACPLSAVLSSATPARPTESAH